MKTCQIVSLLTVITFSSAKAATTIYDFESGIPSDFVLTEGVSQTLNSTIVYSGAQSLRITTGSQPGPGGAVSMLSMSEPIISLTYSIYDEFATNSQFYMYLFLGSATLAWQDAPLSDSVLIYGGSSTLNYTRSPGWHTVDVDIQGDTISYQIDNIFLGTHTELGRAPIYKAGFCIDSAGSGTYSMYIDQVQVATIPEPSSSLLGVIAFCGFAIRRSRSYSPNNN
ncbi:MAG: hypothetical protein J0M04_09645 [Verrucomicrobia bacterium]|nr:hypothetical protein [Verrucomicrobiota bacterium]